MIEVYVGDCLDMLKLLPDSSVDLIITSPPYADARKHTYGGIHPDKYVEWFLPRSHEMYRVLKPTGTFILNIKEKCVNGERHTYVLDLICSLRKQGWLWTEEFIWHKTTAAPGKWPNRFRDSWERLLQFNKQRIFNMYQDAVKVPVGDWSKTRLKNLSTSDKTRQESRTDSGVGRCIAAWEGRDLVYPSNVLHLAPECGNKNHSAVFPDSIPEWFIKLFSQVGDVVLDPFAGSGTTNRVAERMGRNSIAVEIIPHYLSQLEEVTDESSIKYYTE